jgi:hypothetical protein
MTYIHTYMYTCISALDDSMEEKYDVQVGTYKRVIYANAHTYIHTYIHTYMYIDDG